MPYEISKTAKSLIVLLNNANELISVSNRRKEAVDVVKALCIYAKSKNFPLPDEKIEMFNDVVLDSRTNTIAYLLQEIAKDIALTDRQRDKSENK